MSSRTPNPQQAGDDLAKRADRILALYGTDHPYPSPYQGGETRWRVDNLFIVLDQDTGDLRIKLLSPLSDDLAEVLHRNEFGELYYDADLTDAVNEKLAKLLVLDELADA